MLLLHLMSLLFPQRIRAVYIDHQLQVLSASWGDLVNHYCIQHQIPCLIIPVQVQQGNLEQQARQARYMAYQQVIAEDEVLVLAHHQQDQAETLILRLLSGAGVSGLSAMQRHDIHDAMQVWRPLLDISREHIEQWMSQLELAYVIDPTNADQHYDRAWSRETLWPILQQRFPQMQKALSRTAFLMQDASEILHDVAQQDWQQCGHQDYLDLVKLATLSAARQRQLLSLWMKGESVYRPSLDAVQRLQSEVIASKADANAVLFLKPFYFVRYQQKIYRLTAQQYLAEQHQKIEQETCSCKLNDQISIASGIYQIESTSEMGLMPTLLHQSLSLQPRQGGERVHLYGRVGTWPLKKAIQEAQIFPWLRHQVQILLKDDVILGVFTPQGFWLAQSPYCQLGGWMPKQMAE